MDGGEAGKARSTLRLHETQYTSFFSQVINKTSFEQKLKKGEKFLEVRYLDRETTQLWTPDLYISNMKSLKNTGFVDHPGIKIDVDINKTVYYSRYAEVN